MAFQPLLFKIELKGTPLYELNSSFHGWGIIVDIKELGPAKDGTYQYRYRIGNALYHELILLNYEIENNFVALESLDKGLKEIYSINFI